MEKCRIFTRKFRKEKKRDDDYFSCAFGGTPSLKREKKLSCLQCLPKKIIMKNTRRFSFSTWRNVSIRARNSLLEKKKQQQRQQQQRTLLSRLTQTSAALLYSYHMHCKVYKIIFNIMCGNTAIFSFRNALLWCRKWHFGPWIHFLLQSSAIILPLTETWNVFESVPNSLLALQV